MEQFDTVALSAMIFNVKGSLNLPRIHGILVILKDSQDSFVKGMNLDVYLKSDY